MDYRNNLYSYKGVSKSKYTQKIKNIKDVTFIFFTKDNLEKKSISKPLTYLRAKSLMFFSKLEFTNDILLGIITNYINSLYLFIL